MTCFEAQKLLTEYINDELDLDTEVEFVNHVRGCKDCKEELEVYYALLTAMHQLDTNSDLSDDYNLELEKKMARTDIAVKKQKQLISKHRIVFILLTIFVFAMYCIMNS